MDDNTSIRSRKIQRLLSDIPRRLLSLNVIILTLLVGLLVYALFFVHYPAHSDRLLIESLFPQVLNVLG